MEISGRGVFVTLFDALFAQPLPSVPLTVYVPLSVTVMLAVVSPVLHRYEVPPLAVRVAEPPSQKELGPLIEISGSGFLVTLFDAVFEQVLPSVPVTV